MGSRGEAQVGGLGTNPEGGMGNEVPHQKLTTFLGLKVYFTQNSQQFHILTKLDSSFSHFGLHTLTFGLHWLPVRQRIQDKMAMLVQVPK